MKRTELYKIFDEVYDSFTTHLSNALDGVVSEVLAEDSLPALKADNLALRKKLNHFKKEYGRASTEIGRLRAELALARSKRRNEPTITSYLEG